MFPHRLDLAVEFADPEIFARVLASTGPGYEAIQNVGEAAFAKATARRPGTDSGLAR